MQNAIAHHPLTDAQPVPEQRSLPLANSPSFYTERDAICSRLFMKTLVILQLSGLHTSWLQQNHRITESQNRIGWKRPLRPSSPTINLTLPSPPLHHVPKHLIQAAFRYLQGWGLHHFPGQPGPMLDNPFSEEKFPNIQSKPPLAQLEAISSHPITCDLGEETDPTSLQPPSRQL
ncbi:hypothetical protein QYF61_003589 [Mycteria americana]|uniref:Uncharacterized protein n=1 Tax=Mycteria americana TaxID=33587 RepID=A0AAN7N3T0_MYCAM|nr:hypothetical protein QYF61_003589 [Mycteria americana]